jgi:hypothetical protein
VIVSPISASQSSSCAAFLLPFFFGAIVKIMCVAKLCASSWV